jgi:allantoin racemase
VCGNSHNSVHLGTFARESQLKIRIVIPICHSTFNEEALREFSQYASPGTEISVANIAEGPRSIESEYEEAMSVPGILTLALEAERVGCDAVISDCFGDPGIRPGREVVNIPVIGPAEASFFLAAGLGQRFSVVTVLKSVVPMIEHLVHAAGLTSRLASVRTIDIPVLGLSDTETMKKALYQEMVAAIEEDDAHVLVLGCTGMMGVAEDLQAKLHKAGFEVPVVSPTAAAVHLAETMVRLGLRHSRLTYMRPKDVGLQATAP